MEYWELYCKNCDTVLGVTKELVSKDTLCTLDMFNLIPELSTSESYRLGVTCPNCTHTYLLTRPQRTISLVELQW